MPPMTALQLPEPKNEVVPASARFAELYRSEHDFVWRCMLRLGFHKHEADDLTQDVFLVVHRRLDDVDNRRPIRAWLHGIAWRVGRDYRRGNDRRGRRMALFSANPTNSAHPYDLEDEVARREAGELVSCFLESVDAMTREIFVLYELEGFHGSEIASALGLNVNSVHGKVRRGRKRFETFVRRRRLGNSGPTSLPQTSSPPQLHPS